MVSVNNVEFLKNTFLTLTFDNLLNQNEIYEIGGTVSSQQGELVGVSGRTQMKTDANHD